MAVIMIADAEVNDPEAYEEYLEKAPAFVARHGGEYLARGGAFEVLRGDWKPTRLVIFRFPSRQAIDDFMNDPDYRPLKAIREAATTPRNLLIVDAVDPADIGPGAGGGAP